jgi:uroporphyrinogen decarboxylase
MTSLERVRSALAHCEPDRVPYDLGGTILTGINRHAYERLRHHLSLTNTPIAIEDHVQNLAKVDDDLKDLFEVDVEGVNPTAPSGYVPHFERVGEYTRFIDEWRIGWFMPFEGGLYYDMREHPLANIDTVSELENWPFPDPTDDARFVGMAEAARRIMHDRGRAYVLGRNAPGIFEVALWLRGFENFYSDMLTNVPFAEALLDRIMENKARYWEKALSILGEDVMVISEADDLASQSGPLISPAIYRKLLKPRHTQLFAHIRKSAKVPIGIFYHSCGAIADLIPDLIESGVDILNPVQVSAAGMDTKVLKRRFGDAVSFWGGGVDTQHVLPYGTPVQVGDEVRRRIDDLAPGGGFVFAAVHNIQGDVPPQNIIAMHATLRS